jgi:ParB family chromosome partitioning protein
LRASGGCGRLSWPGLDVVPVIVRSFDEQQKLELALIENIQRAELNPLEVATAYRKLMDQFNLSLGDIAVHGWGATNRR